jgi:hypothetical protein
MKKLLVLAFLSLLAAGLSQSFAAAGWFCHGCCAKLNACASQYNAFSPFCVTGVSATKHCHHCSYPAEGPCCAQPTPWCEPICCGDGVSCSPTGGAGAGQSALGILPAPASAQAQAAPATAPPPAGFAPPTPSPMPAVPGSTSYLFPGVAPGNMIQPAAYQPTPWYWNTGN